MQLPVVKLVAMLLLTGQTVPVGLPLLCDQVQRGTSANCGQEMAPDPSGPSVEAATHDTPCPNPALCATPATAVDVLSGAVCIAAGESRTIGFGVSTSVPTDPRAPVPPPPEA